MEEYDVEIAEKDGKTSILYPRAIIEDVEKEAFLLSGISFLYEEKPKVKISKPIKIVAEEVKKTIEPVVLRIKKVKPSVKLSELEKDFENIPEIDDDDEDEREFLIAPKADPIKKKVVTDKITVYKKETKTFIDKDGFEVTEETEVPVQKEIKRIVIENKPNKPHLPLKKTGSKNVKRGTGVQQSFTAFLKKKR